MIIANRLKDTNRAEFLLYMWQIEDILRVYGCDADRIDSEYLSKFNISEEEHTRSLKWYEELCEMMRTEGVQNSGHLQINKNVLLTLEELHEKLIKSTKFPYYHQMYYKVLPYIVELRRKGNGISTSDLEICFEALYGILLLKLKNQELSEETLTAKKYISMWLGQLSDYYFKDISILLDD